MDERGRLSAQQRRALEAAATGAVRAAKSSHARPNAFPFATIRSLVGLDYLADDDLGGYVLTPQGWAALRALRAFRS